MLTPCHVPCTQQAPIPEQVIALSPLRTPRAARPAAAAPPQPPSPLQADDSPRCRPLPTLTGAGHRAGVRVLDCAPACDGLLEAGAFLLTPCRVLCPHLPPWARKAARRGRGQEPTTYPSRPSGGVCRSVQGAHAPPLPRTQELLAYIKLVAGIDNASFARTLKALLEFHATSHAVSSYAAASRGSLNTQTQHIYGRWPSRPAQHSLATHFRPEARHSRQHMAQSRPSRHSPATPLLLCRTCGRRTADLESVYIALEAILEHSRRRSPPNGTRARVRKGRLLADPPRGLWRPENLPARRVNEGGAPAVSPCRLTRGLLP